MSPLHWVALNGNEEMAEMLICHGADVNRRDHFSGGLTPLGIAKLMGYEGLGELLGRNGGVW